MESATDASSETPLIGMRAWRPSPSQWRASRHFWRLQSQRRQHRAGDAAGAGRQARSLEFHQARNIRERLPPRCLNRWRARQRRQASKPPTKNKSRATKRSSPISRRKVELQTQAEEDQRNYDALNYRDDQFDLSDTLVALAISLLALTALTHKPWLYWLALIPTAGGVVMGLAGLLGWHLHPDMLARLLS